MDRIWVQFHPSFIVMGTNNTYLYILIFHLYIYIYIFIYLSIKPLYYIWYYSYQPKMILCLAPNKDIWHFHMILVIEHILWDFDYVCFEWKYIWRAVKSFLVKLFLNVWLCSWKCYEKHIFYYFSIFSSLKHIFNKRWRILD